MNCNPIEDQLDQLVYYRFGQLFKKPLLTQTQPVEHLIAQKV